MIFFLLFFVLSLEVIAGDHKWHSLHEQKERTIKVLYIIVLLTLLSDSECVFKRSLNSDFFLFFFFGILYVCDKIKIKHAFAHMPYNLRQFYLFFVVGWPQTLLRNLRSSLLLCSMYYMGKKRSKSVLFFF